MQHVVVCGARASQAERNACEDLRRDLEAVTGTEAGFFEEHIGRDDSGSIYLVGTPDSSGWVAALAGQYCESLTPGHPGPAGGIMRRIDRPGRGPIILLAGSDAAGAVHMVHDFARDALGIDPFHFFTGYAPKPPGPVPPHELDRTIPPPHVPFLCYLDAENDELANVDTPPLQFSRETWRGVIDTLARARYNALGLHDHLGRGEFYRREGYRRLRPDYRTDLDLIDWVIDYAHARGLKVQVPMSLGWEFLHISEEEAADWPRYRGRWTDTWRAYLKDSPLGKADIFLNQPRSPLWDCAYVSADGEDTGAVMTEAFTAMRDVVLDHNPEAMLVCDLYAHGATLWQSGGFSPPPEYVLLWPDNGYAVFDPLPQDTRRYRFGTHIHAGYWLNHEVQDPYPARIAESMRAMAVAHSANHYCLVNGQNLRPFLLNLEACSRAAYAPVHFDGEDFARAWAGIYFGHRAMPFAARALELLHEASEDGYVRLMHETVALQNACAGRDVVMDPGVLEADIQAAERRMALVDEAARQAAEGAKFAQDEAGYYHDAIDLPIRLFRETLALHVALQHALLSWNQYRRIRDRTFVAQVQDRVERVIANAEKAAANRRLREAATALRQHLATRAEGNHNPKWKNWYDPGRRRPHGGFPDLDVIERTEF